MSKKRTEYAIGAKPGLLGATCIVKSGNYFDFQDPHNSEILIEDIAHGLANTCRFGGQCLEYYSVAQHSVLVSQIVPEPFMFAALMHDAAEAYIGDIVGPLKQLLPDYKRIEKTVESAVCKKFGITLEQISHPEIKKADLRLLRTEQRDLTSGNKRNWNGLNDYEPLQKSIKPLLPLHARQLFLSRFNELTRQALNNGGSSQ